MACAKAQSDAVLKLLDKDGSGTIKMSELSAWPGSSSLADLDTNGDGVISKKEFNAWVVVRAKAGPRATVLMLENMKEYLQQSSK